MSQGEFQLISKFHPSGDQPKAIAGLVEGLNKGEKYQTLLGATGTGKSVAWHEPVTVRQPGGTFRGPIGELIDSVIGKEQFAETVEGYPEQWEIVAWNPETGETGWQSISAISRHKSPSEMYRLTTSCGRNVTVTGDHSVWVLRDGELRLLAGSDVIPGDSLPAPSILPEPENPFSFIDENNSAQFPYAKYFSGRYPTKVQFSFSLTEAFCQLIAFTLSRSRLHLKGEIFKDTYFHLHDYKECLRLEDILNKCNLSFTTEIIPPKEDHVFFAKLSFKTEEPKYITIVHDELFSNFFWNNFPAASHPYDGNQLPEFWNGLSNYHLSIILKTYFDLNGYPHKKSFKCTAGGIKPINNIQESLLRFGIHSSVELIYMDTSSTIHCLTVEGLDNLKKFQKYIGFEDSVRNKQLQNLVRRSNDSSVGIPTSVTWTTVKSVDSVRGEGFVYDFSIPGYETFLTGRGGLFVHNTFSVAQVIQSVQRPALVIAHNKTLVAQLCSEFREFFPNNAVEYFVSYFDYYQPEAYIPSTDTFIEKDSSVNDEIDRLRHAATQAVLERRDVIIVASVSCIYGLGSPQNYRDSTVWFNVGQEYDREDILRRLVSLQFARNDVALARATFRMKGDTLEVMPKDEEIVFRIHFDWETCSRIQKIDWLTGDILGEQDKLQLFPATHFVSDPEKIEEILKEIEAEMEARKAVFLAENKLIEAQRIEQRVKYDLEMIREIGFCSGIENYSRVFDRRPQGSPPHTLLDYFPDDFVVIIDESHQTIPQLNAMYAGDKKRKDTLIEFGFRLPSAADNRPLRFQEFRERASQTILVSATPGPWERENSSRIVEQIIRPTGLIDPEIQIRPTKGQIDDLIGEIQKRTEKGERVLVTTLTKKMAEDLTEYLVEIGSKVQYLHSDVHTLERSEILRDLRLGIYDVVVGINLLREGLDLPEVSMVAILDADKEGFLRSETSLIQTIGRAARNVGGQVLMYADTITGSMRRAIDETTRRRAKQEAYNKEHGITPTTVKKAVADVLAAKQVAEAKSYYKVASDRAPETLPLDQLLLAVTDMEKEMKAAARNLDFEHAAQLRDEIARLKKLLPADAKKK
ncbi:MAG: excinuclease ABC subunit UvrB [Armatimonas sp.]